MDRQKTNDALSMCAMPKEVVDAIFKKKRQPFEVFK